MTGFCVESLDRSLGLGESLDEQHYEVELLTGNNYEVLGFSPVYDLILI